MRTVEKTLSRLDGVTHVSAGWRTNKAAISVDKSTRIDMKKLNEILQKNTSFKVVKLDKL